MLLLELERRQAAQAAVRSYWTNVETVAAVLVALRANPANKSFEGRGKRRMSPAARQWTVPNALRRTT